MLALGTSSVSYFWQAADVLAVIGVGGGRVHICSVERASYVQFVMDVHVIESEPVLSRRLVERV